MTTPAFTFALCSYAIHVGWSEDGDDRIMFAWFVIAEERATGRRWGHDYSMTTGRDIPPAEMERLLARVEASGINPKGRAHWEEVEPAYGSPSWTAWDRAIDARERADELAGLR